jgi:hypothetical protein
MRLFSLLVAACALCQSAAAQTPSCKSIADSAARLACYDKSAAPVVAPAGPTMRATPASRATANSKYVDTISAEDALMNERIKGICRGC